LLLLKQKLFQVDWNGLRDSCGSSRTSETPQAFTSRSLTARPAESEQLELQSTTPQYLVNSNKVCENSINLKDETDFYFIYLKKVIDKVSRNVYLME
jgi:hypothetical protein